MNDAVARRGKAAVAWWAGTLLASGVTFALTIALDSAVEPPISKSAIVPAPELAAIVGTAAVAVIGGMIALWASWTWLAYRRVARGAPTVGTLHVWRQVRGPDRFETFSGTISGHSAKPRERQFLAIGPSSTSVGPACRLGLGLGVATLGRGVYDVVLVGTVAPGCRVIVVAGDEVILAAWPTRKLRPRHGTPPTDTVRRSIPDGWRAAPPGLGSVLPWQVIALVLVGLAGVAASAWLATTTAPALAVSAALAGWALVAVGLVAAWSSHRALRPPTR